MSWNPTPVFGGARWNGNATVASTRQLLSTSSGLYEDLKDFNFSTISVSTLIVPIWISTPVLYVSDIIGANIDISGIVINKDGVFNAPVVSLSSVNFKGFDSLLNLDVSFDFGLGNAIGGIAGGLGALVGGATIAVGTGVGLAIQGAEQGLATLVAGRPQNFISQENYETINFTTQLQISTLGNAYPLYSSIFRTVSSVAPNQVPGPEIFLSTFFSPGQICIRAVSDPFNLITGDSNLNTSTIQSYGQWVPLENLEPTNIIAESVSTNTLSTNFGYIDIANVLAIEGVTGLFSNVGIDTNLSMNYQADLLFQTGATNYGALVGNLNNMYIQTTSGFIFTDVGSIVENASLTLGSNADESFLKVSSIFSKGNIQANSGYISSLTVENLTVVSTINLTSTNVENITSTTTLNADTANINVLNASTISDFKFISQLGNPNGPFCMRVENTQISTAYDQVSSLTQNILNANLTIGVNDQTSNVMTRFTAVYTSNVEQWASTLLIWNTATVTGTMDLGFLTMWSTPTATFSGTFDLVIQAQPGSNVAGLIVTEKTNQFNPQLPSTILQTGILPPGTSNSYRFSIQSNGWWTYESPAGPPYTSDNSNVFQIYQDINDSYIKGTDRLHIVAGDILLDGDVAFQTITTDNVITEDLTTNVANISTLNNQYFNANSIYVSTLSANPLTGGIQTFYSKPSTLGFNAQPTTVNPTAHSFIVNSPDFIPTFTLIPPFMGSNQFTSYNASSWNQSIWNNTTAFSLGPPGVYLGDIQTALGPYSAQFWINNAIVSPAYALNIYVITSAGSNLLGFIPGNNYGLIQTNDGVTWTLNSNVPDPQGIVGGTFSNVITMSQTASLTQETHTKNYQIQAPNTTVLTGSMNLYADQIRVNSRRYGSAESAGLASFPIGIENTVYVDAGMSWTQEPPLSGIWETVAANIIYNINNTIFYDFNSWIIQIIPSRLRTNVYPVYSWDVQPGVFALGGGGFCWGYNRFFQIASGPSGPGVGTTDNYNWIIAFPRNYCTY